MRLDILLAALPLAYASPLAQRSEPAPLYRRSAGGIVDKYIIKFREGSPMSLVHDAMKAIPKSNIGHTLENVFQGFTARLDAPMVEALRMLPDVEYIEEDQVGSSGGYVTQKGAPWGLGRISHRKAGITDYTYDSSAGQGVCAYVTDSGVDEKHPEFEGRAFQIKSYVSGSNIDDLGHGTHCAGTIGAKTYGVAKKVTIYGVKVLSKEDRFQYSDLISAWDFITKDAPKRDCPNGVVTSVSLGGGFSQSLNDAANSFVDKGYFLAIAAGNNNGDTSKFSPGSAKKACTVGGTQSDDKRYNNSNFGPLVDINGPAVGVLSTLPNNRTASYTGTSMATPHIAGLAAYMASRDGKKASPSLCDEIVKTATSGAIKDPKANTVNLIAFNGNPSG